MGVEEVFFNPRGVEEPEWSRVTPKGVEEPAEVSGEGFWPMIKPNGHSAGAKRVELHPSGSWCNDIRNVEISVLV